MVKAKLLIVDDEEVLLTLFVRKLEMMSYMVYSASSGIEALEILRHEEIDVLVTDLNMPGMDGSELIAKAIDIIPMLLCIIVTGCSEVKTAIDAHGARVLNYFPKPLNFAELDITIQKGLHKRNKVSA